MVVVVVDEVVVVTAPPLRLVDAETVVVVDTNDEGDESERAKAAASGFDWVAVGAAATTVTDCDTAATVYASFPAWLAEITHVPTLLNETTPAEIGHTVVD